jgi:hypothetical protein
MGREVFKRAGVLAPRSKYYRESYAAERATTLTETDEEMPQLYMLTVRGLQVKSDWAAVHDRLLDDFPQVTEALATTMTETLLIACEGDADVDGWLEGVSEAILSRRLRAATRRSPGAPPIGEQEQSGHRAGTDPSVERITPTREKGIA